MRGEGRNYGHSSKGAKPLKVINDTKTMSTRVLTEAWPEASIEEVPAKRKEWGLAPRTGLAVVIQPGIKYAVTRFHNAWEQKTNGILQSLRIDLPHNIRVTGTYVSPNISATILTNFLTTIKTTGTGKTASLDT